MIPNQTGTENPEGRSVLLCNRYRTVQILVSGSALICRIRIRTNNSNLITSFLQKMFIKLLRVKDSHKQWCNEGFKSFCEEKLQVFWLAMY